MSMVPDVDAMAAAEGYNPNRPARVMMPEHWQALVVAGAVLALIAFRKGFKELMPR